MDLLKVWIEDFLIRVKSKTKKYWFQMGLVVLVVLYFLGFLATGLSKEYKGFSPSPIKAFQSLFSVNGRTLLLWVFILGGGAYLIYWLRNSKFAGTTEDERGFLYTNTGTYGTAKVMDRHRMREVFHTTPAEKPELAEGDIIGIKEGRVISRPKDSYTNRNSIVIGNSGTMKSRTVVRNAIHGCKRRGESMIITDPKGEMFRDTSVWLRKAGYTVRALNLKNLRQSHGWNFLLDALEDADGNEVDIVETIAWVIIRNTGGGDFAPDFWDKGEGGLLKAAILFQYYLWKNGEGPLSFPAAYEFLLDNNFSILEARFNTLGRDRPGNAASNQFKIFAAAGERICPNVLSGLLSRLSIFNNENLSRVTGESDIDLLRPAKEKCVYFLIISDQDSTYKFISSLFFTLFFIRVVNFTDTYTYNGECPVPVTLLLDEFVNIGEIPDFPEKVATVRSRNIGLLIIIQSVPHFQKFYDISLCNSIISNCDLMIFLGANDLETAKLISDRAGETTIRVETQMESLSKFNLTQFTPEHREAVGEGRRMIYTIDEIMTMRKDNPMGQLLIPTNQHVLSCDKFDFIHDPATMEWELFILRDFNPSDPFWLQDGVQNPQMSIFSFGDTSNEEKMRNEFEKGQETAPWVLNPPEIIEADFEEVPAAITGSSAGGTAPKVSGMMPTKNTPEVALTPKKQRVNYDDIPDGFELNEATGEIEEIIESYAPVENPSPEQLLLEQARRQQAKQKKRQAQRTATAVATPTVKEDANDRMADEAQGELQTPKKNASRSRKKVDKADVRL